MKPRLKSSPAARELIKRFEPFRHTAERGADGRWVVGYGHRAAAREGIRVSEEEAALLLIYDVMRAEDAIDALSSTPLARGQRDALISFVHDVGAEAFRNSDVARYLFEGRVEAAGEALAAYGDGSAARREAEAAMFLDALLPAVERSRPVELVIKVEHPREERVLEGAIATGAAGREPVDDFVPPPPMPDRAITSRREAEAEIARILATVEAMPLEEREALAREEGADGFAPMEDVVADMSDAPVDGRFEAVDDGETPREEEAAADTDMDAGAHTPEARVAARMAQEIGREAGEAGEDEPAADRLKADFELPAGTELGFALTRLPETQAATEQAATETASADAAPTGPEPERTMPGTAALPAAAAPRAYALDLPEGCTLGYAFAPVMTGRFRPRPDPDTAMPAPAPAEISAPAAPQAADEGPPGAAASSEEEALTEIVERAVTVAGEDTPPPHPAEQPAESVGAVGEVEGEKVERGARETPYESVSDDPLLDGSDPLTGGDEFSPRDLAADMHTAPEKPADRTDDGGWGFLASFAAGAVVSAFGTISTWGDWPRMWSERTLTGDGWILIAGVFLMLVSAWFLGAVWVERLKRNKRDTAKEQ
jgi:GH24 family phage-related lysozyme (muramidase)